MSTICGNGEARLPADEQLKLKLQRFIEANITKLTGKIEVTACPDNTVSRASLSICESSLVNG
jgi:predicted acetyltransferase